MDDPDVCSRCLQHYFCRILALLSEDVLTSHGSHGAHISYPAQETLDYEAGYSIISTWLL